MSDVNNGQSVSIGGKEFVLPVLTLGGLKKVSPALKVVQTMRRGEMPSAEQIDAMVAIVHMSAQVHEPSLSLADFAALVEALPWDTGVKELSNAFAAVAMGAGLIAKEPSEGEATSP